MACQIFLAGLKASLRAGLQQVSCLEVFQPLSCLEVLLQSRLEVLLQSRLGCLRIPCARPLALVCLVLRPLIVCAFGGGVFRFSKLKTSFIH